MTCMLVLLGIVENNTFAQMSNTDEEKNVAYGSLDWTFKKEQRQCYNKAHDHTTSFQY